MCCTCPSTLVKRLLITISTNRRLFLRSRAPIRGFKSQLAVVSVVRHCDRVRPCSKGGQMLDDRIIRLAAIRSFFRFVTFRDVGSLQIQRVRATKRYLRMHGYLTRQEFDALLAVPSKVTWAGRRRRAAIGFSNDR
jgi:hypothetical protein